MKKYSAQKIASMSLLLAFALLLSYVESLIPFYFGIPGAKLGLPNFIVLFCIWKADARSALWINGMRIILAGFLFGSFFSILYSLAGGLFSFIAMVIGKKTGFFSITGVGILGGVFHNIGQLLVAMFVVQTVSLGYYAPMLMLAGLMTGLCLGVLASYLQPYLSSHFEKMLE